MMEAKSNRENVKARVLERLKKNYTYDAERGGVIGVRGSRLKSILRSNGYEEIGMRMEGKVIKILLHRAVWALCHGRFPAMQIDHLNGDKRDNRIENLREADGAENLNNIRLAWRPNAETGVPGVCRHHGGCLTSIRGRMFFFSNAYEAFFQATMCGKRFR